MGLYRRGLELLVPIAYLVTPELALEDLLGPLEAIRGLVVGHRSRGYVGEAVDVLELHGVEQHPVVPSELGEATLEGLRMDLLPVARHRPGKVDGVELPRPGPRGIEAKLGCCLPGRGQFQILSPSSRRLPPPGMILSRRVGDG